MGEYAVVRDLVIETRAWQQMLGTVAVQEPETGGIIGGRGNVVSRFHFDALASADINSYHPDAASLNEVIQAWQKEGVQFLGVVHSHMRQPRYPSVNDLAYARSVLNLNRNVLKSVVFILFVCPFSTFEDSVFSFVITRNKCHSVKSRVARRSARIRKADLDVQL